MKPISGILALALLTGFLSCRTARERKTENKNTEYPSAQLVANFDAYQNSASVSITAVSIAGNVMTLGVSYSGGCEEHEFKLLGSEMIQKSLPPKRGIMLFHDNHGDSCREFIEKELKFDISVFAYEGGEIILNLTGWETPISYTAAAVEK